MNYGIAEHHTGCLAPWEAQRFMYRYFQFWSGVPRLHS